MSWGAHGSDFTGASAAVGRERDLQRILHYIMGAENAVGAVTSGRSTGGSGLGNMVFSMPECLRAVEGFLAEESHPAFVLGGETGVGKSTLLRATAAAAQQRAGLVVFLHTGAASELLRRAYDGIDEPTDEELLLMPSLARAGKSGGVVLLLDQVEVGPWLPLPLPPGVRCVMVPHHKDKAKPELEVNLTVQLLPKHAAYRKQQELGFDEWQAFPMASNPLWLTLATVLARSCPASQLPTSMHEMVARVLDAAEDAVGQEYLKAALGAMICSDGWLQVSELDALLHTQFENALPLWIKVRTAFLDALITEDRSGIQLASLLQTEVEQRYFEEAGLKPRWHRKLAVMLMAGPAESRWRAARHWAAIQDITNLMASLTDYPTFSKLDSDHRRELVEFCRIAGGYVAVREAFVQKMDVSGPEGTQRRRSVAGFLSHVGEFSAARDWLFAARRDASVKDDKLELGRICNAIARNEIGYWDSRRDWRNVRALADLLEASKMAVSIFTEITQRAGTRAECAVALTAWANGCFKAACVCEGEEATEYLDQADAAIEKVQVMFATSPPSRVVGRALLVGGVARMVRSHNAKKARRPWRWLAVEAAELYMRAEHILVQAVGEVNEGSIYTHGNLAELFLHDRQNIKLSLVHFIKCCRVGVRLWGPDHPNVRRKLQEFHTLLPGSPIELLQGDISFLDNMFHRFIVEGFDQDMASVMEDLRVWATSEET